MMPGRRGSAKSWRILRLRWESNGGNSLKRPRNGKQIWEGKRRDGEKIIYYQQTRKRF